MQQQTLSLLQFQKKFGTEKACQKQLFGLRWPEGFKCPRCGQTEACRSFLEGQITKESKQYHSSGEVEDFYE
jgi:predicted RNA-binding Zn-ribbon protein involved in translation (DUF1610 family)